MSQQDYWKEHYRSQHAKKTELGAFKSMDYPNDRLQAQTYAQILEGLGRLNHRTLLDAGCGWGLLGLFRSAVANLWELVAAGGRLVACVPNALCPFVQGVHLRLDRWIPVAPAEITDLARTLPGCSGLTYLEDQSFLPYSASPWASEIVGTPNRIVFALLRQ